MINIYIQFLTLFSGLLVNFFIPILFGLEEYGLFIKANLVVFLFHKFTDVVSEPLISNVDKRILLPVSISIGLFITFLFLIVDFFFSAGSPWLLISMIWSSCVLLTMIAQKQLFWVLIYLCLFVVIFLILLGAITIELTHLTITNVLGITNLLPSTFCLFVLISNRKLKISFNNIFSNFWVTLKLIPRLFSLTLVNNLFTNILPFYLSFIFSPHLLGLFRVQVSIVQSVTAIFPIHSKVISEYLRESSLKENLINQTLCISLNYFHFIALIGYIFVGIFENQLEFAQVFIILPIMHASMILERYLLGSSKNIQLIIINLIVAFFSCIFVLEVHSIEQMMLLYATGVSFYLFLLVFNMGQLKFKNLLLALSVMTPLIIYYSNFSSMLGAVFLLIVSIIVLIFMPVNKQSLALIRR